MIASTAKPSATTRKKPPVVAILVGVVVAAGLIWGVVTMFTANYAEQVAKPLEKALVEAGAVKKCSRGDSGRGWDNREPNYKALYEVPGDRDQAADIIKNAAQNAGFSLHSDPAPSGSKDNHYSDKSKPSTYENLEKGNVNLLTTVFTSSTRTEGEDPFCTVEDRGDRAPANRTTIDFTINMPPLKR